MKTFIIVKKENMEIMGSYEANEKQDSSAYRSYLMSEPMCAHIETPEGLDKDCVQAEMVEGEIEISADSAKVAAKLDAQREAKLARIRQIREPKLARVDQLVNVAFLNSWTAGEKTELKDYRAELLNITEEYKADMSLLDSVDPEAMSWPTEPSEV